MERETLSFDRWSALEASHEQRVDALTAGRLARRSRGLAHPVEDFLHDYYGFSPGRLRRWHPGPGVVLAGAEGMPRAAWRFYRAGSRGVALDVAAFLAARGPTVTFVRELLTATLGRTAQLGCFALHEWAMVYRLAPGQVRHTGLPLRLGAAGTDAVVDAHPVRCSHFDAFRFFTDAARPRNGLQPTRATQVSLEQPGCLHAGMDVYKWAYKLAPAVPSDLVTDAYELAHAIRVLDMRASPYDVTSLGHSPVRVETPEGKAEFAAAQRGFTQHANTLRHRLIAAIDAIEAPEAPESPDAIQAP